MKMHIIFLHPSHWEIICVGTDVLNNNEPLTMEQAQDLHHNPQSALVILPSLGPTK